MMHPGPENARRISASRRRSAPQMATPTEKNPGAPNTAISEAVPNLTWKELWELADRSRLRVAEPDVCPFGAVTGTKSLNKHIQPKKRRLGHLPNTVGRGLVQWVGPFSYGRTATRSSPESLPADNLLEYST